MSIYEIIKDTLKPINIPVSINQNTDKLLSKYVIMIPIYDRLAAFADDKPTADVKEVELAVYSKGNYLELADQIVRILIEAGFTITNRKYIEYEEDTKLHHYIIDLMMEFVY